MTYETQLPESDSIFPHEVELEETEWKITLTTQHSITLESVQPEALTTGEEWETDLKADESIPTGITLNTVTFSVWGTYYDAYATAIDTCEYLNTDAETPGSDWEFDDPDIRRADQPQTRVTVTLPDP